MLPFSILPLTGAPSSSPSLLSPSTAIASAASEPSTETEETATEMETEPELNLEPPATEVGVAPVGKSALDADGKEEMEGLSEHREESESGREGSVGSRVDQGTLSLSEPGAVAQVIHIGISISSEWK